MVTVGDALVAVYRALEARRIGHCGGFDIKHWTGGERKPPESGQTARRVMFGFCAQGELAIGEHFNRLAPNPHRHSPRKASMAISNSSHFELLKEE
jgi:hypothetical protein